MTHIELLNTIDIPALERLVSEYLGYFIKFDVVVETPRRGFDNEYLSLKSQDLKSYAGIMGKVYESLHVTDFGGSIASDKTYYWISLHFSFQYKRGSNGCELLQLRYRFETKKWEVIS